VIDNKHSSAVKSTEVLRAEGFRETCDSAQAEVPDDE
jgi:hypothetical protein